MHKETLPRIFTLIEEISKNGNLTALIGQKEDLYFEAKNSTGYDLNKEESRIEFSKDVSAFANSNGGVLVIGLNHKAIPEENTDMVESLDLFNKNDLIASQYQGVLQEYVYPKMLDINFLWLSDKTNTDLGVFVIVIPKQDEAKKYFLMKKNLTSEDKKIKGIVAGIAQRVDSSNVPLTVEQLYQKIQQGKSSTAERLTRIEQKVDSLRTSSALSPVIDKANLINERVKNLINLNWE